MWSTELLAARLVLGSVFLVAGIGKLSSSRVQFGRRDDELSPTSVSSGADNSAFPPFWRTGIGGPVHRRYWSTNSRWLYGLPPPCIYRGHCDQPCVGAPFQLPLLRTVQHDDWPYRRRAQQHSTSHCHLCRDPVPSLCRYRRNVRPMANGRAPPYADRNRCPSPRCCRPRAGSVDAAGWDRCRIEPG